MAQLIDTVIVGGGQAGLSTSYYLTQQGRPHVVLEQATQAGNAWRNERWDSFTLVTPNWSFRLPGAEYQGQVPDGFMPRAEIVTAFESYVQNLRLPVQYQARVTSVERDETRQSYRVIVNESEIEARNVVIASGLYQRPKLPAGHAELAPQITQLHTSRYRRPQELPPGGVLVAGSGQSGCQIAEELYQSGRKVYLCTGGAGRAPRRYRGKDIYEWLHLCGYLDRTPDMLPSPRARFAGNPQISGRAGGHSLNLHQFAQDGVTLLGRFQAAQDRKVYLASDLKQNLTQVDKIEADIVRMIDHFIDQNGLDAPLESLPNLRQGYTAEPVSELNLDAAGVQTVIWALGFDFDFSLVKLPVVDEYGFPLQKRGISDYPGLFFVGMPWLYKFKSGQLLGMAEDAQFIAQAIAARS